MQETAMEDGTGTIELEDGTVVSRGEYRLNIRKEEVVDPALSNSSHVVLDLGGHRHARPTTSVDGYIESLEIPSAEVRAVLRRRDLVLKLEDGRKLPFFFHLLSERRTVGYLTGRGPLK